MAAIINGTTGISYPSWTTSARPTSPVIGQTGFNTTLNQLEVYGSAGWAQISTISPTLISVSGYIFNGISTTLSVTGTGFGTGAGVVRFTSGATQATVSVTPSSQTSLNVTIPSTIYALSGGTTVTMAYTNDQSVTTTGLDVLVRGAPTGGTITTTGSYRVHTFTSSDNFVIPSTFPLSTLSTQYLVVAGGGGGGAGNGPPSASGGGGGAGGYRSSVTGESSGGGASAESALSLVLGSYTVTIGGGGAGVQDQNGTNGQNSVFATITSLGGGGGQCGTTGFVSGGSGGGADYNSTGGSGTSGQGYAGGGGRTNPYYGGGGGGAGAVGADYNTNSGRNGDGGIGVTSSINGTATYRAGGGGSGVYNPDSTGVGLGGLGGGGNGGTVTGGSAVNGTANTGGGAGGGPRLPANGGSGVVIVRYILPT